MRKFVLSKSEFKSIGLAEKKVTEWWGAGTLEGNVRLYEVKAVYKLKLKFVKQKGGEK